MPVARTASSSSFTEKSSQIGAETARKQSTQKKVLVIDSSAPMWPRACTRCFLLREGTARGTVALNVTPPPLGPPHLGTVPAQVKAAPLKSPWSLLLHMRCIASRQTCYLESLTRFFPVRLCWRYISSTFCLYAEAGELSHLLLTFAPIP